MDRAPNVSQTMQIGKSNMSRMSAGKAASVLLFSDTSSGSFVDPSKVFINIIVSSTNSTKLFCRDSLLNTFPPKDFRFFYADDDSNTQPRRVVCGVRQRRAVECTASSPTDPVNVRLVRCYFAKG